MTRITGECDRNHKGELLRTLLVRKTLPGTYPIALTGAKWPPSMQRETDLPQRFSSQDSLRFSAGYEHVLQVFYSSRVLSAFEGSRIRTAQLAHAALHLTNGVVLVVLHPFPKTAFYVTQMIDSVAQQGGAEHGDVGANHEQLDDVFGRIHTTGGCQVGLDAAVEDADPSHRQA